jgi:hypothetical protein
MKTKHLTVGCVIAGCLIVSPFLVHNYFAKQEAEQQVNAQPPIVEEIKTGLAAVYYYEEDKAERYTAYQELHPELSDEDIVWQVNAGLDYPFYEIIQPADLTAPCLIVNKYYALAADYEPEDLVALPSGKKATTYDCASQCDQHFLQCFHKLFLLELYICRFPCKTSYFSRRYHRRASASR